MRAPVLLVLAVFLALGCAQDRDDEPPAPPTTIHPPTATSATDASPTSTSTTPPTRTPPPATPTPVVAGCGRSAPTGSTVRSTVIGDVERTYRFYVPQSYDAEVPVPLVLNLHGYGSNAQEQERYADLIDDAESAGFLLVTPEALGEPKRWYVRGPLERGYVDDVSFLNALLDELKASFCADPERIYVVGISNGAAMATLLACSAGHRIAAIALVAGAAYPDECPDAPPIPVLAFHGTSDFLIPFDGDALGLRASIGDIVYHWAEHNGCSSSSNTTRVSADVELLAYQGCRADVQFYVVEGGGHTWPGTSSPKPLLGRTTQTIDASAIIWDFFKRH